MRWNPVDTIRTQLILLVVAVMVPVSALWAWYIHTEAQDARKAAFANLGMLVNSVANNLQFALADDELHLQSLAHEYQGNPPAPRSTFSPEQFLRLHDTIVSVGVRDLNGNNCSPKLNVSWTAAEVLASPWGAQAVKSDDFVASSAYWDPKVARWVSMLTYPVRDAQGQRSGFAYLAVDLLALNQRALASVPTNLVVPVFDRDDHFLLRSLEPQKWIGKPLPQANASAVRGKVNEQFASPDVHGVQRLYALMTLPQTGWRVFAGISEAEALAPAYAKRQASMVFGVVTLLLLLALVWWRAGVIANPIRKLASGVRRMEGDPQFRIAITGPVEVTRVADRLNVLRERIEQQRQDRAALSDHYASIIRDARDIVLLFNPEGRVVDANAAALAAYGYSAQEFSTLHVSDLVATGLDQEMSQQSQAHALYAGVLFEARHRRKDGTVFDAEESANAVRIDGKTYRQSFIRDITQRKAAEAALKASGAFTKSTLDAVSAHLCVTNRHGTILTVNQAWRDFKQANLAPGTVATDDVGSNYLAICEAAPPPWATEAKGLAEGLRRVSRGELPQFSLEYPCHSPTQRRWFNARVTRFHGDTGHLVVAHENITERKLAELALVRRSRTLQALSACNHALVNADDAQELLDEVCQMIISTGGYMLAWVGFAEQDADKTVRLVAHAGLDDGYLAALKLSWAETPTGLGPAGTAIRSRQPVICHNVETDPNFALWREAAVQRGYAAVVALPLITKGEVLGVLCVYKADADAFDASEMALLEELSKDLAYGIANLRITALRLRLEDKLAASEARFRMMIESSPAGMYAVRDGVFVYANPRMEDIMGLGTGQLVGNRFEDFILPEDRHLLTQAKALLMQRGKTGNYSVRARRQDGVVIELGLQDVSADYEGEAAVIGMAQDISERSRAQMEIQRYIGLLEHTTEATLQAVAAMVEQRDPYTAGHERRVGELAAAIGREMGLPEDQNRGLRLTGMVHDIGKIAVPAELLSKPSALNEAEMALIRMHAQTGFDVLKNVDFPWPVAQVILQHHERLDGSGYPRGLKGNAILLESCIMAVADVVESMSSHRPYRPSLGLDAALAEVQKHSGTKFDAAVVDACVRLFRDKGYHLPV